MNDERPACTLRVSVAEPRSNFRYHRPMTFHHAIPTTPNMIALITAMYAPCFHSFGREMAPLLKYTADCPLA